MARQAALIVRWDPLVPVLPDIFSMVYVSKIILELILVRSALATLENNGEIALQPLKQSLLDTRFQPVLVLK